MKKIISTLVLIVLCLAVFVGCSYGDASGGYYFNESKLVATDASSYVTEDVNENNFVSATSQAESYFSMDRNTSSYSYMRRQVTNGYLPNKNNVRLEEYVNYFNYNYTRPTADDVFAFTNQLFACPWNAQHKILTIGVAAEEVNFSARKQANIVFLIDTSGSMYGDDRLGLIQQAFTMLLDSLNAADTISIVTYAGDSRIALQGESGNNKTKIAAILSDLQAEGSTNGEGGIQKAYALAEQYFVSGGINRVILATDGDFNVGISNKDSLKSFISQKRESGIYLSVLGVGMGNTNDTTMKTLAENGNGNYAYLDTITEARKVLVEELGGTMNVVAKDCKAKVVFNSQIVEKYRLIGYETKLISAEEYEDEQTDAGEIGSGHTVTAVYEVELKADATTGNVAEIEISYKKPSNSQDNQDQSTKQSSVVQLADLTDTPSEDSVFIGCVVEYGLLLRQSDYKADASFNAVINRLKSLQCVKDDAFKAEFLTLVQKASEIYQ